MCECEAYVACMVTMLRLGSGYLGAFGQQNCPSCHSIRRYDLVSTFERRQISSQVRCHSFILGSHSQCQHYFYLTPYSIAINQVCFDRAVRLGVISEVDISKAVLYF